MEEAMWREKRGTAQLTWESLKYNVMYCKCEVMKNTEDPESLFSQNPLFMVGPNRPNRKVHNFESSVQVERLFYCYLIFLATSFTYHQYRVGSICPCGLLVAGWQDSSELKCPFLGQSARQSHPPGKGQGLSHWGQGQQSPYIQGPGISCFLLGAQGKNGERPNTTASL